MNFLSSFAKGGDSKDDKTDGEKSSSDLFASARVVAEAAQAQFGNEPEKCDKVKAAGAGADLLDAASSYGKLDETKGVGKYVDQAEGYLRQYSASSAPAAPAPAAAVEEKAADTAAEIPKKAEEVLDKPSEGGAADYAEKAEEVLSKPAEEALDKPSEGGAADYAKKAEEFLSKPSEGGEKGESEGGFGGLAKAAGGFFNK